MRVPVLVLAAPCSMPCVEVAGVVDVVGDTVAEGAIDAREEDGPLLVEVDDARP